MTNSVQVFGQRGETLGQVELHLRMSHKIFDTVQTHVQGGHMTNRLQDAGSEEPAESDNEPTPSGSAIQPNNESESDNAPNPAGTLEQPSPSSGPGSNSTSEAPTSTSGSDYIGICNL